MCEEGGEGVRETATVAARTRTRARTKAHPSASDATVAIAADNTAERDATVRPAPCRVADASLPPSYGGEEGVIVVGVGMGGVSGDSVRQGDGGGPRRADGVRR